MSFGGGCCEVDGDASSFLDEGWGVGNLEPKKGVQGYHFDYRRNV